MEAHLRQGRGGVDLITPLLYARVAKLDGMLHLQGYEVIARKATKSRSSKYPQSWLCALETAEAEKALQQLRSGGIPGFTADDDAALEQQTIDDLQLGPWKFSS